MNTATATATGRIAKQLATKLLLEKVESKLLIVCPITGLISTMELPSIEGFFLEQVNPIAATKNLFKLSQLEAATLSGLEKPLLAGILLGLYKSINLLEQTESSSCEQNLLIQSVHPTFIIESIKFFSSSAILDGISKARKAKQSEQAKANDFLRNEVPSIRLSNKDGNEKLPSSIQTEVRNYKKVMQEFIFPQAENNELVRIEGEVNEIRQTKFNSSRIAKAILAARRTAEGEQKELLKEARSLNSILFEMEIINVALNNFIKLLLSKDTLKTADSSMKERAVKALKNKNTPDATKLAVIIMHKAFQSVEDSLFAVVDNDVEVAEAMAEVPEEEKEIPRKKLSFKELMELKKQQREALGQEKSTITIPAIPVEESKENSNA